MNRVTLTIDLFRANPRQVTIELRREGSGDDFVEQRADQLEAVITREAQDLVSINGGSMTAPPATNEGES